MHHSKPRSLVAGLGLAVATVLGSVTARPATAQGLLPGVAGAGAGLAVGGMAAVGYVTARAHFADDYLDGYEDLAPLPAILAAGGLVGGVALGTTDADALKRASLGAVLVGAGGTAMGILAGREFLDEATGPWAGALLGGATGAVVGWVLGAALGSDERSPSPAFSLGITLPGPGAPP